MPSWLGMGSMWNIQRVPGRLPCWTLIPVVAVVAVARGRNSRQREQTGAGCLQLLLGIQT